MMKIAMEDVNGRQSRTDAQPACLVGTAKAEPNAKLVWHLKTIVQACLTTKCPPRGSAP